MTHRTMGIILIIVALIASIGGVYWWKTGTGPSSIFSNNQNSQDSSLSPSPIPEPNPHRIQGWIGEGIPVIRAVKKGNLPVYQNPGDTQSLGNVPVEHGETVNWSESQIIVREKGSLFFTGTITIPVFEYPLLSGIPVIQEDTPREQIFEDSKIIDYLTPRAKGAIIVYIDHKYLEIDGTHPAILIEKEPMTEFWVYALVTKDAGGWVHVDDQILKIASRKF